jgi:hypothetical protein
MTTRTGTPCPSGGACAWGCGDFCVRAADEWRRSYQAKKNAEAKGLTQADIAAWRKANPHATCSDAVALKLAALAHSVGRV